MIDYQFYLVQYGTKCQLKDNTLLSKRPFVIFDRSFQADARRFVPGEQLDTAINTAIAVGNPLLLTGEPGTGKTQTAYYVAYKLNIEPVIHFQVKSDSTAQDLLYYFDTVKYFHDAYIQNLDSQKSLGMKGAQDLDKGNYIEPRVLWKAFKSAIESDKPRVLLIDEIDKASRDFPNDLLHELDKMEFTIKETGEKISAPQHLRPIVFITSNSERRLPEPFLRRCVYHHIHFCEKIIEQAVGNRKDEFSSLSDDFLKMALERFLSLRSRNLRKYPATGELLMWLRVLSMAVGTSQEKLDEDLSKLPYLGVLLKDHNDIEEISGTSY